MRIRWQRVVVLVLAVTVALMATRPQTPIGKFFHSMANLGPDHSDTERMLAACRT
jgi:hypothetical protein